ncbi:TetR/AcrR family transcriptional regulator [Paenibacillus sp. GCM10027626]|uniref:TetR/AcrR family transcriptional regulator n=1 Tax=Paenibacillus sp. GCM10027626 TaxID=3273411 RepID=UPI00362BF9E6
MQYLKDDVKNNILQAALGEFSRHGYLKASMRQIATAAGVTPGNIYRYFKNKEDLLDELLHPVHQQFASYLGDIQADIEQNFPGNRASDGNPLLYCNIIEDMILKLIQHSNTEFRIMLNQSEGSKYEKVKQDVTGVIVNILERVMLQLQQGAPLAADASQWIHVTASTLNEGICLILRDYDDGQTVSRLITELLHIYTVGISKKLNLTE